MTRKRLAQGLLLWVLLAAAYMLLAGEASPHEIETAAGLSLMMAAYGVLLGRLAERRLSLRAPWPRLLAALFKAAVIETALLARAILTGERGTVDHQPFLHGDKNDGGRRAIVTLLTTATPNGIVLRTEAQAIAVHRMVRVAPRPDRRWPL